MNAGISQQRTTVLKRAGAIDGGRDHATKPPFCMFVVSHARSRQRNRHPAVCPVDFVSDRSPAPVSITEIQFRA